jgi:uncharacterized protein (UPF0218 family)
MKLTIVSVSTAVLKDFVVFNREFQKNNPGILKLELFNAAGSITADKLSAVKKAIQAADAVIVDLMGSSEQLTRIVVESLQQCKGHIIPIGRTG